VLGTSSTSFGVKGQTNSSDAYTAGVVGVDNANEYESAGVRGESEAGTGVLGFTSSGAGVYAESESGAGLQAVSYNGPVLIGTNGNSDDDVVSVDTSGNEILAGTLTQSGQPESRMATSNGKNVTAYGDRTSRPTVEDFGEAQLLNGRAYVALDAAFASTIDQRAKYMVFLTPQGDSRGLYVVPSDRGFTVRENNGGHSSLTFDYRIVAKPFDTNGARLAPTTAFSGLARGRKSVEPLARPLPPAHR